MATCQEKAQSDTGNQDLPPLQFRGEVLHFEDNTPFLAALLPGGNGDPDDKQLDEAADLARELLQHRLMPGLFTNGQEEKDAEAAARAAAKTAGLKHEATPRRRGVMRLRPLPLDSLEALASRAARGIVTHHSKHTVPVGRAVPIVDTYCGDLGLSIGPVAGAHLLPLGDKIDYCGHAGDMPLGKALAHIYANGGVYRLPAITNPPALLTANIARLEAAAGKGVQSGPIPLNAKLPQILLPRDGGYLAVTPVSCLKVASDVAAEAKAARAAARERGERLVLSSAMAAVTPNAARNFTSIAASRLPKVALFAKAPTFSAAATLRHLAETNPLKAVKAVCFDRALGTGTSRTLSGLKAGLAVASQGDGLSGFERERQQRSIVRVFRLIAAALASAGVHPPAERCDDFARALARWLEESTVTVAPSVRGEWQALAHDVLTKRSQA